MSRDWILSKVFNGANEFSTFVMVVILVEIIAKF